MAPGIVVVKEFTFRGEAEEWSNGYHFTGSAPTTEADWRDLCDDFISLESACLIDAVHIVRVLCYEDYSEGEGSVYTYDLASFGGTVAGALSPSFLEAEVAPGDNCMLLRWNTGRRSSRSKPIYLFKYLHGVMIQPGARDTVQSDQHTAGAAFALGVMSASGDWPGIAGPDGVAPIGHLAETYIHDRQLKRGRRRPT